MPPSKKIVTPAKLGDPLLVLFRHGRIALASTGAPRIFYDMEHFKYTTRRFNGSYLPTDELVKYVQERRGEWESGKSGCMCFCSACEYAALPREQAEWNFCPCCGARMTKEEADGDEEKNH